MWGAPWIPGDPLICLGGDHAITHPIMRAVRRRHPSLTILHIDAHPDIYHAYQGNPRSHTSPFARIMEERLTDRLIQVGLRTVNDHHREQFKRFGVEIIEAGRCGEKLRLDLTTPVYISMDIDALDPAYAPGVSHREPGGLSTRQVIDLIHAIDQPIVAADIVEYNPRCDNANITAIVAAKLLKEIGGMMLNTSGETDDNTPRDLGGHVCINVSAPSPCRSGSLQHRPVESAEGLVIEIVEHLHPRM